MTTVAGGDVLDLLTSEHREVQTMITQIRSTADAEACRDLADRVIANLVRHSVAEEMYVYPVIREYLPDGEEAVEHDVSEHKELEQLMKRLEGLEPNDPDFTRVVVELQETVEDHVRDEEVDQFPQLRALVPAEELQELREKVERAEAMAPTRPHPSAPNNELFHKIVGPGVGMVDRLRDALSGRLAS